MSLSVNTNWTKSIVWLIYCVNQVKLNQINSLLTFQRYSFKQTSILVRAFSRFTLQTIYCITQYSLHNKQQTSQLHDKQQTSQQQKNTACKCPWLQANLSYQSKIEPKQFLTLTSRLYFRKQAYTWGHQTIYVLGVTLCAIQQNGICLYNR